MIKRVNLLCKFILIVAIVIHLTIKDYYYWSSIIFYSCPLFIIFILSILLVVLNYKSRFRWGFLLISIILSVLWLLNSYDFNDVGFAKKSNEIVFWNAARKRNFEDAFDINQSIPDVLVLVEYDETKKADLEIIKSKYKNYYFQVITGKIGIFSKHKITHVTNIELQNNSFMVFFNTKILDEVYNFYVIDITSSIKYFKKPLLKKALKSIHTKTNTIVLGDFNTPYESIHLQDYKDRFLHAHHEKGYGFRATWPWNLPVLSLDHIWVSHDINLKQIEKQNTFKSDHVMLRLKIE